MSTYNITTNFTAKDTLPASSADRVIRGSEFGTEFNNIKSAIDSHEQDIIALQSSVGGADPLEGLTATVEDLNLTADITVSATEINYLSGVTSNIQTQINNLGGTDGLQTQITNLTNRLDNNLAVFENSSVTSGDLSKLEDITVSATEINRLAGIINNVQSALNALSLRISDLEAGGGIE